MLCIMGDRLRMQMSYRFMNHVFSEMENDISELIKKAQEAGTKTDENAAWVHMMTSHMFQPSQRKHCTADKMPTRLIDELVY